MKLLLNDNDELNLSLILIIFVNNYHVKEAQGGSSNLAQEQNVDASQKYIEETT